MPSVIDPKHSITLNILLINRLQRHVTDHSLPQIIPFAAASHTIRCRKSYHSLPQLNVLDYLGLFFPDCMLYVSCSFTKGFTWSYMRM